jgi:hypothetical protein
MKKISKKNKKIWVKNKINKFIIQFINNYKNNINQKHKFIRQKNKNKQL